MNTNKETEPSVSDQEIAARAYELWENDGRNHGRDLDYWLQAKNELSSSRQSESSTPSPALAPNNTAPAAKTSPDGQFDRGIKPGKKTPARTGREPLLA